MNNHMNLPWIESPFFNEILATKNLNDEQRKMAVDYNENGFIVIPNFFSAELLDSIKSDMDNIGYNPAVKMTNQRDDVRVQDLWMHSKNVKNVAVDAKVLEILEMLYDRTPIPFQTLNFRVGSQQRAHADTIHFSSIPAKFMCGVWVALEDINEKNGAVFYYPKSHKLPEFNFSHFKKTPADTTYVDYVEYEDFIERLSQSQHFERKPFYAKKGDILIWSSNIIHGGSKLLDPQSSRYSMVTHYYFKDCIYYTPMLSNMVTNELFLRNDIIDINTGEKVKQSFNGFPVKYIRTGSHFILNNRLKVLPRFLRKLGFGIAK